MDHLDQLEKYLHAELLHCEARYALLQEMAWIVTSEMTHLENRERKLASDLQRLGEAHSLFSQPPSTTDQQDKFYCTPDRDAWQDPMPVLDHVSAKRIGRENAALYIPPVREPNRRR